MSKKKIKFKCDVVHENVRICLCKHHPGFMSKGIPWVKCDQEDCQYVKENRPPCPLEVSLFKGHEE